MYVFHPVSSVAGFCFELPAHPAQIFQVGPSIEEWTATGRRKQAGRKGPKTGVAPGKGSGVLGSGHASAARVESLLWRLAMLVRCQDRGAGLKLRRNEPMRKALDARFFQVCSRPEPHHSPPKFSSQSFPLSTRYLLTSII